MKKEMGLNQEKKVDCMDIVIQSIRTMCYRRKPYVVNWAINYKVIFLALLISAIISKQQLNK